MLGYVYNKPRSLVEVVQNPESIQPIYGPCHHQPQQADTYEHEYDNYYPEEEEWYDENRQSEPSGFEQNRREHIVQQEEEEWYDGNQQPGPSRFQQNGRECVVRQDEEEWYDGNQQSGPSEFQENEREHVVQQEQEEFEDENEVVEDEDDDEPNVSYGYDILYDLLGNDRAYSEKMAVIAKQLYLTAMTRAYTDGYNDLNDLDAEVQDYTGVSGSKLAELMGYPSFKAMCLNSMEIVELFTWKREQTEVCGRTVYEINNFAPIVSGPQHILYDMQMLRLQEQEADAIKKYVQQLCDRNDFPTDEELAFRFRICQTLDACNAMEQALHHSALLEAHEKLHNERLNASTYRKAFPSLETRIDMQQIVKARMHMEIISRRTISRVDPNTPSTSSAIPKSDNLEFVLRKPLAFINDCYKEVAKAREEHAKRQREPQPRDSDDECEFGKIKPRFC
ncbi:hypothetical protein M3Y94_00077700 [Aphelenchoides besseyi]|nr:hypothetical protein M3Y94_00077700 [Aphelenchoides besseyi]